MRKSGRGSTLDVKYSPEYSAPPRFGMEERGKGKDETREEEKSIKGPAGRKPLEGRVIRGTKSEPVKMLVGVH